MTDRVVLVGGGEHARVVAEAARSAGLEIVGFVDPQLCEDTVLRLRLVRLGEDAILAGMRGVGAVLGVGSSGPSEIRRRVVDELTPNVERWATVIHASSWVSPTAMVGQGTVIMAGAVVNTGARIGCHCVVNTGAVIEHDVVLEDYAQVAPGATVGGGAVIGEGAFIGLGAAVRDHVTIGAWAFVGMGAVVVADVPVEGRARATATIIEMRRGGD